MKRTTFCVLIEGSHSDK